MEEENFSSVPSVQFWGQRLSYGLCRHCGSRHNKKMKKNILAVLTLLIPFLVLARPSSKEIEIKNGGYFLRATKTGSKLSITSHLGSQVLDVKNCNSKVVEKYWRQLSEDSKTSLSSKRARLLFAESKKLCRTKTL